MVKGEFFYQIYENGGNHMILKVPLNKCNIFKKSELEKKQIVDNDSFKICTGCVDQYIITEDSQLYGVISSFDIEREMGQNGDFDLNSVINTHPISITQSERFEKELAEYIFSKTVRIHSIPVVNERGQVQYVYMKVNKVLRKFVEQNFEYDIVQFKKAIKRDIANLEKTHMGEKIRVLSDFNMYGITLDGIEQYYIKEKEIDSLVQGKDCVLLAYLYDFNCIDVMEHLIRKKIKFCASNFTNRDIVTEVTPYFKMDKAAKEVLEEEAFFNADYFDMNDFQNIFQAIRMTENLNGCYLEIGTYRGDSARAALSYMKKSGIIKKAFFLDTYEGFEYAEAEESCDCEWANTHGDTSIGFVRKRLQEFTGYQLIRTNIITDALPEEIEDIAVCNIDVDMYEAVESALEKVFYRVMRGGVIIAEDFGHTPILYGAQFAVSRFLSLHKDEIYGMYLQSGQYIMIKK